MPITYPKVVLCFRPSTQTNTAVAKVPNRPDLADDENKMQRWLGFDKIGPYARQKHPDWKTIIYDQPADVGSSVDQVRAAYTWLIGQARANPSTLFVAVDGHTDSGDTPHFGFRWLGQRSNDLALCIAKEFKKFWTTGPLYWQSPGYIAVGGAADLPFPSNLVGVICEEDIHTDAAAILRWVGNSDATAKAIVDGVAAYVASLTPVEPPVDWKKRAEVAEAKLAMAEALIAHEVIELSAAIAGLRGVLEHLTAIRDELKG